jgi:hypothetical protein
MYNISFSFSIRLIIIYKYSKIILNKPPKYLLLHIFSGIQFSTKIYKTKHNSKFEFKQQIENKKNKTKQKIEREVTWQAAAAHVANPAAAHATTQPTRKTVHTILVLKRRPAASFSSTVATTRRGALATSLAGDKDDPGRRQPS